MIEKYKLEIKWGLIFTVAALIWMVFEKLMGWHDENIEMHPYMTNIFAIVAIGVFVFALRAKRRQLGGSITWKEGFVTGILISVVVALLSPLAQWITSTVISPGFFPNAIKYAVEHGKSTQAEAEAYFNLKSYIIQGSLGGLVMGVATSAIVAFFIKTKR